ncbi:hypothetical protein [Chitinophaga pinensis]|uniref:Uncharacterized protein n=1 Tax=Chitinophaga pinensis TaxID=79329 RepID=A0A5C6LTS3_9BACT|nr:hypothetical protein [Chitinophaga pinensis]TWW00332.1 hypothetical protein FEF09_11670 [Chitinophaga pinensis]
MAQSVDKEAVPGIYVFKSLTFDDPVDINRDGKSSRQFEAETDACATDMVYELNADGTGKYTVGQQEKDCKNKQERAIRWKIRNGKAGGPGAGKIYLVISDADGFDPTPFEILKQAKNGLSIRGEFRDGSDSTASAVLELKKKKP